MSTSMKGNISLLVTCQSGQDPSHSSHVYRGELLDRWDTARALLYRSPCQQLLLPTMAGKIHWGEFNMYRICTGHIVCGSGCNCFFWPVLNNVPCQLFECGHVCKLVKRYSRWVSPLWVSASRCQCLGTILRGLYLCGLLSESQSRKWIIARQSWKWYGKLLSNSKSRKDMERLDVYLCYILYVLNGISVGNQWKSMRFWLFEDFGARITGCHYMWYLWDNLQLDFSWSTTAGYVQHGCSASFLLGRTHS